MGVSGLTTFIANERHKYLKKFKLHDCYIIIDGNSIAYHIYCDHIDRARGCFGGDYDIYAQHIKEFFSVLSVCAIKPIVLFDGGYEKKKVKTVVNRMNEKLKLYRRVGPTSSYSDPIFPLLMKTVMKEILREINVPFVQCEFEADQEIASLARKYNCPVLSNDSDFYIYDVKYIPIPTTEFVALPLEFKLDKTCVKYYLRCKMYKVEYFLESFSGLSKSKLPLMASLLGNDYMKLKFTNPIPIEQMKGKKNKKRNLTLKRVSKMINWLQFETFDSAIEKALTKTNKVRRRLTKSLILKSVHSYICNHSTVEKYLPLEFTSSVISENFNKACQVDNTTPCSENADVQCADTANEMDVDNGETFIGDEDDSESSDEELLPENNEDVEMTEEVKSIKTPEIKKFVKIPEWLVVSSRKGNIEPCVYDIISLQSLFPIPQVQDKRCLDCHGISIPILKKICKLLLGYVFESITVRLRMNKHSMQKFLLHLTNTSIVADIEQIPNMPVTDRKSLFLKCLDIPVDFCIDNFPNGLKLYVCAILFWAKSSKQVTKSYVLSLLMCVVALNLVRIKVGVYQKKIEFLKKYGKVQKKIIKANNDLNNESEDVIEESGEDTEIRSENTTIKEIYSSITTEDCVGIFVELFKYHQVDQDVVNKRVPFSIRIIHSFSQFQSCLFFASILNSLLDFPFERPVISQLYSGTFIYNMCATLNNAESVNEHIQSILKNSPNILNLVESISAALSAVVEINDVQDRNLSRPIVTKHKRKKRKKAPKKVDISNEDDDDNIGEDDKNETEEEEENYSDVNNTFSLLSTMG